MKTQWEPRGSAKAIVLPAELLAASGFGDDVVEVTAEAGRIVISPVAPPRRGWFDGYRPVADEDAFAPLSTTDADSEEWEW